MSFLIELFEKLIKKKYKHRHFRRVVAVLSCVVVFVTTYALILPAITMERQTAMAMPGISWRSAASEDILTTGQAAVTEPEEPEPEEPEEASNEDEPEPEDAGSGAQDTEAADSEAEPEEHEEETQNQETESEDNDTAETETEDADAASSQSEDSEDTEPADADKDDADPASEDPSAADNAATAATAQQAAPEIELITEDTTLTAEGSDYKVYVTVTAASKLPKDTRLQVREITKESDEEEYQRYFDKAQEELRDKYDDKTSLSFARFYDISFEHEGVKIEPAGNVNVRIEYDEAVKMEANASVDTIHFDTEKEEKPEFVTSEMKTEDGQKIHTEGDENGREKSSASNLSGAAAASGSAEDINTVKVSEVEFESDKFSVYGIVGTTIEEVVLASDGNNYRITATYGSETGIPVDAELEINEITADSEKYAQYVEQTETALGLESGTVSYARLFDISITYNGEKVQPADGTSVKVAVELADKSEDAETRVVHFGDETEEVSTETEGQTVSFEAGSFSVYSIIEVPEPESQEITVVESISELNDNGFYLYVQKTSTAAMYYFLDTIVDNKLIGKSKNNMDIAAAWYFELVEGTENQFRLYLPGENNTKTYMVMDDSGNMSLSTESGTEFYVEKNSNGTFYIYKKVNNSKYGLNMFGGDNGKGFAGWTGKDAGSGIWIMNIPVEEDDPLGLDGQTFALINYQTGVKGIAMMSEAQNSDTRLKAMSLLLRNNPLDSTDELVIAKDTDAAMWTFHHIEGQRYYITTEVDGVTKYLRVSGSTVNLVTEDELDDDCVLSVEQGTGSYSGKIRISNSSGYSPNLYSGNVSNGFGGYNDSGANEWFNLASLSDLTEDDFVSYSAYKVSVSDRTNVPDGAQVVVYTRVWNDTTKEYDFYAIDHDGNLVYAYESGDKIEWVGLQVNNMLWDFTEYHTTGTETPNYYYELQNTYSGLYIAPNLEKDQIVSEDKPGLNLNGRRYGNYYSTILSWDDTYYDYAGLKVEDGKLVPCSFSEADDFYFAIMKPVVEELTTVSTVDNDNYGISMTLKDHNGAKTDNGRYDVFMTSVLGQKRGAETGLVTPYLDGDYPIATKTNRFLSELYEGGTTVNHLFLESTYEQSGYFEFDSTQNFAHLEDNGDFTVYNQIGTIETSNASMDHGQFMPYNDLTPGVYSSRYTNQTNELDETLSDLDPRKGEALYAIPYDPNKAPIENNNADYHYAMEMEASFTQTANGLDAWGHDIIFEFAGDDDMYFYVDGVLILDLGGTHPAQVGKVNFRTGEVTSSTGNSTLRALFETSYKAQYPDASDTEVEEWLDGIFKDGGTVFQDYSTHTMKMFYMERGAGASNLHMRFNLASVKRGTVVLNKKLSGTDNPDNSLIDFPYQIYYKSQSDPSGQYRLLEETTDGVYNVKYKGTSTPVTYKESFTPQGGTTVYENVFFIHPGESAVISLPTDTIDYYIQECAVNPSVYDEVTANGDILTGTDTQDTDRKDYAVEPASMEERQEVNYDNHVSDGAMRTMTITKKLYDSDGLTELYYKDDPSLFSFRLSLGSENSDEPTLANMYRYMVKDPGGYYCVWDAGSQSFASLVKTDYSALTDDEKEDATFHTSIYGTISKIPTGYMVEVRDLVVGTKYKVQERLDEIPKGYTLRLLDGYMRTDEGYEHNYVTTPVTGTMQVGEDPAIQVSNQKGWGLTIQKTWSDKDFMETHDTIYYAVYINPGELVENTVRQMTTDQTEIYYFFNNMVTSKPFRDYMVREVMLEGNLTVDEDGYVTGYDTITPVEEDGQLTIGGTAVGGTYIEDGYTYSVHYEPGEQTTENQNVRTDQVTNSRPGIELYKADLSGNMLAGATFTLKNSTGEDTLIGTYTSDSEGLITTAYLSNGDYTLTETSSPKGYVVLPDPVTITLDGETVTVSGVDEDLIDVDNNPESGMIARITVKNRPGAFKAQKVDADTDPVTFLEGVHFALYKQVTDISGNKRKDYLPMRGYSDLVTDENGTIPNIDMDLPANTYYLTETAAAEGYDKLDEDLIFTVGEDGTITINSSGHSSWLSEETDESGNVSYTITIPNSRQNIVSIWKTDEAHNAITTGASFALYKADDYDDDSQTLATGATPVVTGTTGTNGILTLGELAAGSYRLVETSAPSGYNPLTSAVEITIYSGSVTAIQSGTTSEVARKGDTYWVSGQNDKTWQIRVWNNPGVVLPSTGSTGTMPFYLAGGLLVALAAIAAALRKL